MIGKDMQEINFASIPTPSQFLAEKAVVALDIKSTSTIISLTTIIEPQAASPSFDKGRLSNFDCSPLSLHDQPFTVPLILTPDHDSFSGNELADASA